MFCLSLYFSPLYDDCYWTFLFFSFLVFSRGFLRLNFSNSSLLLSCSFLLFILLLVTNMISRQKNAGCQMKRCHAIFRQWKFPEHSRPQRLSCLPTSTSKVCARRRTGGQTDVRVLHNQNFSQISLKIVPMLLRLPASRAWAPLLSFFTFD